MKRCGAIELGGTKTLVAAGETIADLEDVMRLETTDPETTLGVAIDTLNTLDVDAVGVACFGPLDLRPGSPTEGHITSTPKPGWSGVNVKGLVGAGVGVPVSIDTDVSAAAIAESMWGVARDVTQVAYVTVGTGIGAGLVVDGVSIHGSPHPEMGHTVVQSQPDDDFAGVCPFHGRCLEGMASGPAIESRFGQKTEELDENDLIAALTLISHYLAQGLRNLVYVFAPQRIVVGGGLSQLPGFHEAVRDALVDQLAGYPEVPERDFESFVVEPGLGDKSGLAGGLALAMSS